MLTNLSVTSDQTHPPSKLSRFSHFIYYLILVAFTLITSALLTPVWLVLHCFKSRNYRRFHTFTIDPETSKTLLSDQDNSTFTVVSANLCLLPESLAKFGTNLSDSKGRAFKIATKIKKASKVLNFNDKEFKHIRLNFPDDVNFLCLQEVFNKESAQKIIQVIQEDFDEIVYDIGNPCGVPKNYYRPRFSVENSGLFFASKHEIIRCDFTSFADATCSDVMAGKGVFFALCRVKKDKNVLIVNTHLQAQETQTAANVRVKQMLQISKALEDFLRGCKENVDQIVISGDLNWGFDSHPVESKTFDFFKGFTDVHKSCEYSTSLDPWSMHCIKSSADLAKKIFDNECPFVWNCNKNVEKGIIKLDHIWSKKNESVDFGYVTALNGLTDHIPVFAKFKI